VAQSQPYRRICYWGVR